MFLALRRPLHCDEQYRAALVRLSQRPLTSSAYRGTQPRRLPRAADAPPCHTTPPHCLSVCLSTRTTPRRATPPHRHIDTSPLARPTLDHVRCVCTSSTPSSATLRYDTIRYATLPPTYLPYHRGRRRVGVGVGVVLRLDCVSPSGRQSVQIPAVDAIAGRTRRFDLTNRHLLGSACRLACLLA
ncbi:hypothetical protein BKA81DRAFT_382715 [Phyllosticta paracitricarpa]